ATEDAGDDGKRAGLVLDDDGKARRAAIGLIAPGEIDPVGVDPVGEALAADDMDLDPLALAPEPDDPVAGDRMAAFGEVEGDARRQPLDRDGGALRRRLDAV